MRIVFLSIAACALSALMPSVNTLTLVPSLPASVHYKVGIHLIKQGKHMLNQSEQLLKHKIEDLKVKTLLHQNEIMASAKDMASIVNLTSTSPLSPKGRLNHTYKTISTRAKLSPLLKRPSLYRSNGVSVKTTTTTTCLLLVLGAALYQTL